MNDRLEFVTQQEAQDCADAIHAKMQAVDPAYAKSVAAGQTTAWAIPYQDGAVWCVNVKDRGRKGVKAADVSKLKPFAVKEVATVEKVTK